MHGLQGIHHLAVIASDYATSKHFYSEILGFPVIDEHFRAERDSWKLDLSLPGGAQLELFSFPAAPPRLDRPESCGLRHLAFAVRSVEGSKASLEASGIEVEPIRVDETTGRQFTFFKDPDGLPLEIYEV